MLYCILYCGVLNESYDIQQGTSKRGGYNDQYYRISPVPYDTFQDLNYNPCTPFV